MSLEIFNYELRVTGYTLSGTNELRLYRLIMTHRRAERVAEAIKEEVSLIIQKEVKDPRIGFLTVTAVELSDDLRYAKIFVSVYGSEKERRKSLKGLQSATRFIRRGIGQRVKLRYIPEIVFKWDESIEKGAHIEELLRQVGLDDNKAQSDKGTEAESIENENP